MIKNKEDLLQALIEAFLMEKGTRDFYVEASEKAESVAAKKMFGELSDWEERHMDYLQSLYQSVNDTFELKTFAEFREKAKAPVTEAGIPVKALEEKIEKYSFTDETGALTLAMEIEGKAYNLYRKLSLNAADPNARVVFQEMMEQEVKHVKYLKELRVKFVDPFK